MGPYGANRSVTVNRPDTPGNPIRSALAAGPTWPVAGSKSR
ncbi:MAG TPA: hypothetical protein VGH27_08790 [Streptosporangiaceae bacterium]|jgi:hypothetical protein